jgi:hypothetical protein
VEAAEAAARKLAIRLCSENEYHASYPEVVRVESSSRVPLVSVSLTEGLMGRSRPLRNSPGIRIEESWRKSAPYRWLRNDLRATVEC